MFKFFMVGFGILIIIISITMIFNPNFIIKHEVPKVPKKLAKSKGMRVFTRVYGVICLAIGIIITIFSFTIK